MDELIPYPPIYNHHDHACILMEDAISDLLGHGYKLDYICEASSSDENMPLEIKKTSETKRAHKTFKVFATGPDQKPVVIWVLKWSDDAEMNSLLQNKGSVWIQSATFSVPEDSLNVAAYTCVMAIGPKEGDHSFCEKMLNESLTKLSSPSEFYHGGLKANVKVGAALFASIADQPEKRSINGMANGNGTCAALWKTSCDLKQVAPKVPSCTACKNRLLMGSVDPFGGCPDNRCANWNIDGTTNLLSFSLANFPFAEKCLPLRLSNQMLMFAIEKTHAFVASEVWNLKSAGAFLSR